MKHLSYTLLILFLITPMLACTDELPNPAPIFELQNGPIRVPGGEVWLFAIPVTTGQIVLSSEREGRLFYSDNFDFENAQKTEWSPLMEGDAFSGRRIADHGHIFAHGHHWIVFAAGRESYLVRWNVRSREYKATQILTADSGIPANDMFLVETPSGVAVGHFLPGIGHKIFEFDTALALIRTVTIGGGRYRHSNGATARMNPNGYTIFAPTTLNPSLPNSISAVEVDTDWRPYATQTLLQEAGFNFAMPSAVTLANGCLSLTVRVRNLSSLSHNNPGSRPGPSSDGGSIVRYIFDDKGQQLSRTILSTGDSNRPHSVLVGDELITTWDARGRGVWIQKELLTSR